MSFFSEHRLIFRRASDYGVDLTPKPMVMNQSLSANGKGIVQGPITTTNLQNGHLVGVQALPKAPNQGYTTVNPATQFNTEDAKYLSQAANTGGVGVMDTRGRNLLVAGKSGSPLQATLSSIDDKYRAAAEAGQSVDPFAVAAEKQAAAAQFQAEESARQGQMQAARDKEAKSVATAQNALTAKTPQGQKIQQITAIRNNVRLGKITQEQANEQIRQIQAQSVSPQGASPVATTTATPTAPANPNASTATTPEVPGAAAVGTQEAAATGTEPVDANGNPVVSPQTPEEAGIDAALLNLPPEAQFLAPFLQSLKTQTDKSLEENANMALGQLASVEKTFGGIQDKLDEMEAGYKSTTEAMQSLLREAKESQEKQIAEAERDQMNRVQWQQDTQERVIMKNKRQAHESIIAQLALNNGFGQDASLRAVAESDDHFETQLADLRTEMGYARTDLSVKFSGLKNEANQNYVNSTITNMKELQANLEKIAFQGMSNKVSKMQAEQAIVKDAWEKQNTLRKDLADKQYNITSTMAKMAQDERIMKAKDKREDYDRKWREFVFQQDELYRYTALQTSIGDREEARDLRRDDKEKYNAETVRSKIVSQMEGNMVFDQFKQARMSWESLETAFKETNNPFRDRALAKSYEKLVEVGSVVMPGEYADITSNVPLASKIAGKISQVANGGQSWTEAERVALKDLSSNLYKAYEKRRAEEAQIFHAAIQFHNQNTGNPNYQLTPEMFNLPEPVSSAAPQQFQNLLPPGYQSPFSNPDKGGTTMIPKENERLTTGFMNGVVTGYGSKYWEAGLDVAAPKGSPIRSPQGGVVEKVVFNPRWQGTPNNPKVGKSQNGGFGNQVVIKYPDGVKMQFSHADSIPFGKEMEGKPLNPGATIAFVGNTGNTYGATGVHADITGYNKDGSLMTAKQVAEWMIKNSNPTYASL